MLGSKRRGRKVFAIGHNRKHGSEGSVTDIHVAQAAREYQSSDTEDGGRIQEYEDYLIPQIEIQPFSLEFEPSNEFEPEKPREKVDVRADAPFCGEMGATLASNTQELAGPEIQHEREDTVPLHTLGPQKDVLSLDAGASIEEFTAVARSTEDDVCGQGNR